MRTALTALALTALAQGAGADTLVMQSVYASSLPVIGETGLHLTEQVAAMTGGDLQIEFNEPNAIVSGNEMWDAISTGAVDAGWYSPGFAQGVIPAAPLFTSVPFGPDIRAYTAWWYHGGGQELWAEITAPYNIHSELCAVFVPEASGWFAREINTPADLDGLRMRVFGLGAQVMEKLGVRAQSLAPADTMTGLRLGSIDAAEMSFPAIDLALGMNEYASHYYFPGWHQQTSLATFIINQDVWDGLSDANRASIQMACAANVTFSMAEGEAIQVAAMETLRERGVQFHSWNDEMMAAFEGAWDEVVAEQSAADADFARVWESLSQFRQNFAIWSDIAYID
ncbi:TRAP transporter substrate-binding protein [Pararhodobacter sp. CCB-MM2]|uniref:TRAP transporter substrate-binding protein n=1 Tax=Pararhodobacter sp. CCB-MM2 TaxID=1786003 RepID=UPI0008321247|nr:TRAP transporter substrate-binding protein [Pararhodobacter sp. CCB-MM2]MCA2011937.1 TRAP transporter substrate-binding protein [Cereibacter sphaeroides]